MPTSNARDVVATGDQQRRNDQHDRGSVPTDSSSLCFVHADSVDPAATTMQAPALYSLLSLPVALVTELGEMGAGRLPRLSPQGRAALLAALSRAGVRPACAADAFAPLPLEVSVAIASLLPAGERLLLALLSRAFRALVAEPGLWRVVDLSPSSGVARVSDRLLRAVVAAARGSIEDLDVSEQSDANWRPLSTQAVGDAVAANVRSLRRLNMRCKEDMVFLLSGVDAILAVGTSLEVLHADVQCTVTEALAVLRNEAPYGLLRVRRLCGQAQWAGEASVLALSRDAAAHASLENITLVDAPLQTAAAATAVVDAAIACRLTALTLVWCSLTPASVSALARLCAPPSCILELVVTNNNDLFLDAATAPTFCAAVRSSKLTKLVLVSVGLWDTPAVGMAVVGALVAHPSIACIVLCGNSVDGASHAAGSLAVLLGANTPALEELRVSHCALGDSGLRPFVQALRGCTHLRSFDCSRNSVTQAFACDELLLTITVNASLRTLKADGDPSVPELAQAEALVAARLPPTV